MRSKKSKLLRWGLWTFVVLMFLAYYWVIGFSTNHVGSHFNKDENAIWLGHRWVGELISEEEVKKLADDLMERGFDTVFVHSGPIDGDGGVGPEKYPHGKRFVNLMNEYAPEVEVQAWLGQVRSKIDLDDEAVRERLAEAAVTLVEDIGFEGIHYDIEPVWDEDYGFIETLKLTREKLGNEVRISVALAEFIPKQLITLTGAQKDWINYNTHYNYLNVAEIADQVVVMVYDTRIEYAWLYRLLVREQTIWLSNILEGKELYIGIPSYDDNIPYSYPWVENVENGLYGIIQGLNNLRSEPSTVKGVAIYANWTTSEEEWEIYENLWLN